jgi:hypothetical protein
VARMGEERKLYKVLVGPSEPVAPRIYFFFFWWESPKERDHWEDQGVGGEIDLEGVDWIRLPQDRVRWRAVVSAVMNLRVLAPRS